MNDQYQLSTLSNGIRIANFSSAHSFEFTDGTILSACNSDRCKELMLTAEEIETKREKWTDIDLTFRMNAKVFTELERMEQRKDIDIILCPLPVLSALRNINHNLKKVRGLRMADRVNKLVHIDKFCI